MLTLRVFLLTLLCLACPAALHAAAFRLFDQDADAMARAAAFVATADNPSAVYYNPAGLTQQPGFNISAGLYSVYIDSDYETLNGKQSTTNRDRLIPVPSLYASYQLPKLPLTVGFGTYSTYGLALFYPDDSVARSTAKKAQIIHIDFTPVVAWQATKSLSLAVGPSLVYSQVLLNRGIAAEGDGFQFRGSGYAAGYEVGVRWEPTPQHAFGISYHSSSDVRESGHGRFTLRLPTFSPNDPKTHLPESDADSTLHFPRFILAGYSYRPTPAWNFEFNLDWTDWSSLNTPLIHQSGMADLPVVFEYQSSFVYHFGATRIFENGYHVSAGYAYSQNSVPERTLDGAIPDNDRHVFTAGVGKHTTHWDWAVSYEFIYQPERTVEHEENPLANGRYQVIANALNASVTWHY